jgi:hypothetical protein
MPSVGMVTCRRPFSALPAIVVEICNARTELSKRGVPARLTLVPPRGAWHSGAEVGGSGPARMKGSRNYERGLLTALFTSHRPRSLHCNSRSCARAARKSAGAQ